VVFYGCKIDLTCQLLKDLETKSTNILKAKKAQPKNNDYLQQKTAFLNAGFDVNLFGSIYSGKGGSISAESPSGITYCIKNVTFRTGKVNFVFAVNAELNSLSEDDINKQGGRKATLSSLVGRTGFELATPSKGRARNRAESVAHKKSEANRSTLFALALLSSGRQDSNLRPLAPHASALPGCATSRTGCKFKGNSS
jgi:hypothetical protein